MNILNLFNDLLIILVLLCALYYCYIYWKYRSELKLFPFFPYPFIGHCSIFIGSHGDTLNIINERAPSNIDSPIPALLGHKLVWFITAPEDVKTILLGSKALQKSSIYKFFFYLKDGLFATEDLHHWRKNRKRIATTLNQKVLDNYVNVFYELSEIFCQNLSTRAGKGNFNMFPLVYNLSVDIITQTILNVNIDQQSKKSYLPVRFDRVSQIAYDRLHKPWKHPELLFKLYPESTELHKEVKNIREYLGQHLLKQRNQGSISEGLPEFDDNKLKPTIELLLELAETDKELSDKQIIDELWTLFVGGSHSTAVTTSFALTLLGMHADIQDKVFEELRDILGEDDRVIVAEDLAKMKLLERVIKETLRLFPPGPLIGRAATDDITLKECTIHKGEDIFIPIFFMQRSEKYWENPLRFDPDRFLPENIAKVHPYAWIPFSIGARNCVGMKFAMMSLKVQLANAIRKFKFHCKEVPLKNLCMKADIMLKYSNGSLISVDYRRYK